ncbi:MAG: hypothetical protein IJT00_01930 [Lachnospiraceae bacterium]|nr:hypothetical protein [Lachnospiraceae bacterium]
MKKNLAGMMIGVLCSAFLLSACGEPKGAAEGAAEAAGAVETEQEELPDENRSWDDAEPEPEDTFTESEEKSFRESLMEDDFSQTDREEPLEDGFDGKKDGWFDGEIDEDLTDGGGSSGKAEELSTDEMAYATEFDWLIDYARDLGYGSATVIEDARKLTKSDAADLNGGWKCYMFSDSPEYFNEPERYLHAVVDTDGSSFDITLNWGYMEPKNGGEGIDESSDPDTAFTGSWDSEETVHTFSESGNVDIQEFYEAEDEKGKIEQYAVGRFQWPSGEVDVIGLMRGTRGW